MRLLCCGGREFTDVEYAVPRLQRVHLATPVTTLICGMAKGGDSIALAWARELNIPVKEYYPDWTQYGRAAGHLRNQRMASEGKPDLVIGLPGGKGTANMLEIARKAGIPTIEYYYHYFSRARDPEWGFLSNFYLRQQIHNGLIYHSNELWYQCEKTLDSTVRQWIFDSPDPATAKKRGNTISKVPIRSDWETYKIEAMIQGLRVKFPDHPTKHADLLTPPSQHG